MNNSYHKRIAGRAVVIMIALAGALVMGLTGCKKSYLEPDPLSFYEPGETFTTESGLMAALAMVDRHLRTYWSYYSTQDLSLPISSEYMMSDLAVASKTDDGAIFADVATRLTPADGLYNDNRNRLSYFWDETYNGIKYANTVLTYIDNVAGLSEATKNEYKGRALFHRSFRYLALCFEFKDVPLVTRILQVPKLNYRTTKREAILQMITADMENAVAWVPDQSQMSLTGMVNKGACRQLLIKCYLATGQYDKAIAQADMLINSSGYSLMTNTFGTFVSPLPTTWNITRNVIWDLHRPENKAITTNRETILVMPDRTGTDATIALRSMRNWCPYWNAANIKTPGGRATPVQAYALSSASYRNIYDYNSAVGRGIAHIRPTWYETNGVWYVNGQLDTSDLRHSSRTGNWARMDSMKYNDPASGVWYGKNLQLYDGSTLLCNDTVRCWFDWPHYKTFVTDDEHTSNANSTNNRGGAADWYCYRLAETYLLRAEAKWYKGDVAGATADVNTIRQRAHCTQLYAAVNIGNIMDERARELWMEEWRYTEMSRVSYCLAASGKADEWGNTYTTDNLSQNSYWFQRIQHYNNYYNKGLQVLGRSYTMDAHNLYLPIPQNAINSNRDGKLRQNQGYDGYDASTPVWDNWQDAVKDEQSN